MPGKDVILCQGFSSQLIKGSKACVSKQVHSLINNVSVLANHMGELPSEVSKSSLAASGTWKGHDLKQSQLSSGVHSI